jgi:hypothetical protein
MDRAKIVLNERGYYRYKNGSNVKMLILSDFFTDDVGCRTTFRDWAETATDGDCCSGNITRLEIENSDILMTDLYPEVPAVLRITKDQFIKLFDEWLEKVCKKKPKEVMIIHDNDEFRIEIKD